jgi:isopenicillin-N epimerase
MTFTPAPPDPIEPDLARLWGLDPAYCFLNHGSFGAVPRAVRQAWTAAQDRLEGRPIELLGRRIRELLAPSRARVGAFLGMGPESFGFVANATAGVNAVLRSLEFAPGDELIATNHVYNAMRKCLAFRARQSGAVYREVRMPLPISGSDPVLAAIQPHLNERTRLVLIDHVTSPTALALPIEGLLAACKARGIEVLVDAAHVPGMLPTDVERLGATYWTGNLHKWCCAPKTAGVLWVSKDRRAQIHPANISHFLDEGLLSEFEWQGTLDISPWMTAGFAIDYMGQWGWDRVRNHNRQMAAWCHRLLCERWDVEPLTPLDGRYLGSMCTVPLPPEVRALFATPEDLQLALYHDHRIEAPVVDFDGRWHIRASAQVYNRADEYERLAQAVLEIARRA